MRRFIWCLLFLIISVWLGLKIANDPGYALFAYQKWSVEMPLWFAALVMIVGVLIICFFLHLFEQAANLISRWKQRPRWRESEIAISLIQAQLQFEQGQAEQALAKLLHLRSVAPKHYLVIKLLERVYIHLDDWKSLLALLPSLKKSKVVNTEQCEQLECRIYQALLVKKEIAWSAVPRKLQKNPRLIYMHAMQINAVVEKEELISQALKKNYDEELVKLYGTLDIAQPVKLLAKAEHWLKSYGPHAVLFLTLGRLAVRCQLWGKARDYFEEGLKLQPSAALYADYGKLLEQLNDLTGAAQNYYRGLML